MDFHFPEIETKRIAIKVNKNAERAIKKGHPWVFEKSITKQSKEGDYGDMAILYDQRENKMMAIGLFDPDSPIRVKLLSRSKSIQLNTDFFSSRIQEAIAKKESLFEHTNAYRLIYGENDFLPGLILDVYDSVAVIKLYSRIWFPYLKYISQSLLELSRIKTQLLRLYRNVSKTKLPTGIREGCVLHGNLINDNILITEYKVQFLINVIKGHKTGFFLDHRQNRRNIGLISKDKTVLDVFCYAGGFSAHAIRGGAKEVTSVDISAQALTLAKANVDLNQKNGTHKTLCGDAFHILEDLSRRGIRFDVVIIDPPSFAKSEKEKEKALKQYQRLAYLSTLLASKNGTILLASCSSRISLEEFSNANTIGFSKSNRVVQLKKTTTHDIDHASLYPEAAYLKSQYFQIV